MFDFLPFRRWQISIFLFLLAVSYFIWHLPSQRQWVLDITLIGTTLAGNVPETRQMLDRGSNIETRDENTGMTPLMCAAMALPGPNNPGQVVVDHAGTVALLLDRGANIHARDMVGKTALHHAAENGHDEIVKILIDRGADVNTKDAAGRTPLDLAEFGGHARVAATLKGARVKE
jgi:ankyrin repeat protein